MITTSAPVADNASSINIAGTALPNSTVTLANNGNSIGTTTADASGHWSITDIALSNGANYSFTATATDISNNSSAPSNQLAFHVDQTPPAAPVITTTGPAQNNASSINVAGTAEANSTVTLANNGSLVGTTTADSSGHWNVNGIPLSTGTDNNFTAAATDAANNSSGPSNALIFHDDQSAPGATFPIVTLTSDTGASNTDFITSTGGVHFAGTVADTGGAGIGSVQVFNGTTSLGTATVVAGNWSLDTVLAAGPYSDLKVTGTDLAGNSNTTSSAQTIIVDTAAPAEALAITAIATDTGTAGDFITSDTTLIVSGSNGALVAGEKIQVSSDGANWFDVTPIDSTHWSYDDTATVHAASFTYQARIVDTAGNIGTPASQAITIANLPAEAVAITAIATDTGTAGDFITSDTTLIVSGTNGALAAGEKIQVSSDGANWFDVTPIDSTHWSYDDTATSHTSSFTYQARVIDAANNVGTTASQLVTIDTALPAAGSLSFTNLSDTGTANTPPVTQDNTFNLTLTGQETGASVAYQVSLNGGAFATTTASQSGLRMTLPVPRAGADAAGNTSASRSSGGGGHWAPAEAR